MRIKVLRAFYGDEKGVKEGDVIEVADTRGRQLIQRKLAERVVDPVPDATFDETHTTDAGDGSTSDDNDQSIVPSADADAGQVAEADQKKAEIPENKQAEQPDNKAATAHTQKAK